MLIKMNISKIVSFFCNYKNKHQYLYKKSVNFYAYKNEHFKNCNLFVLIKTNINKV
jgi:hypothetical protein